MILEPAITIIDEVLLPEARVSVRSDGLVHVHFNKDTTYDLSLQKRLRKEIEGIMKGRRGKFIFSADGRFVLTKEARDYASDHGDDPCILCAALVINNLAYKVIADFYVKLARPKANYKFVGSVADAVEWLNAYEGYLSTR